MLKHREGWHNRQCLSENNYERNLFFTQFKRTSRAKPNLRPNAQASNFARNFESQLGANGQSSANINAISPVAIDKTTPTDRVNAPGFANMFENFIKGVDAKENFKNC